MWFYVDLTRRSVHFFDEHLHLGFLANLRSHWLDVGKRWLHVDRESCEKAKYEVFKPKTTIREAGFYEKLAENTEILTELLEMLKSDGMSNEIVTYNDDIWKKHVLTCDTNFFLQFFQHFFSHYQKSSCLNYMIHLISVT